MEPVDALEMATLETEDPTDTIITQQHKQNSMINEQLMLLRKQLRFTQISCAILAAIVLIMLICAAIMIPQISDTLEQLNITLEKMDARLDDMEKLTEALEKLSGVLSHLNPFG